MLKFELIDQNIIEVSVAPSDEIFEFFTTPSIYFHALWWMNNDDLEELKEKLIELNDTE